MTSRTTVLQSGRGARRAHFLAGAGTAVLTTLLASSAAYGATSTVTGTTRVVTGTHTVNVNQINAGAVTANGNGALLGIVTGDNTGTANTVVPNTITSTATGNPAISAPLVLNVLSSNFLQNGSASLVFQRDAVPVTSNVNTNTIRIDIDNFSTGSASLENNKLKAATTINNSSSVASGTIPGSYSPTAGLGAVGGMTVIADNTLVPFLLGPQSTAAGSVAVTTVQRATDGGSAANAVGNQIFLNVDTTVAVSLTSSSKVNSNSIDATYRGNNATSAITVQSGGAPTFAGSAGIVNDQTTSAGLTGGAHAGTAANVDDNAITATIGGAGGPLAGPLSVSNNSLTASATANRALAADGSAGNVITIAGGMSFDDGGAPGNIVLNPTGINQISGAFEVGADSFVVNYNDLSIASSQVNSDALVAGNTDTLISATVDELDAATVDVNGNTIRATAGSNSAGSRIDTGAGGANFAGQASVTNYQEATAATTANVGNAQILANVGTVGVALPDSMVNVNRNSVGTQAVGNNSGQGLFLSGVNLLIGGDEALLLGGNVGFAQGVLSDANAVVNNYQVIRGGGTVTASTDSLIQLTALASIVDTSQLNVSENIQDSLAIGNGANNAFGLSGNNVGSGAGINSLQTATGGADVIATTTANVALIDDNPTGSDLAVNGNTQQAIAEGNIATNTGTVSANSIVLGEETLPASAVILTVATVNAAYGILNTQQTDEGTTALLDALSSPVLLDVGGSMLDSSATADDNVLNVAAYGNDAGNTLNLSVNNLSVTGGGSANIAAITNAQQITDDVVLAGIDGTSGATVLVTVENDVTDSELSGSGNTFQALAYGNRGTSEINLTSATNIETVSDTGPRGSVNLGFVDASFAVHNSQFNDADSVTARIVPDSGATGEADVRISIGGDILNSDVDILDNSLLASATANDGSAELVMNLNNFSATTGVQNNQGSMTDVSALAGSITEGAGGFVTGNTTGVIDDSTLTVDGNERTASATGNSAVTNFALNATNIAGSGDNASATADLDSAEADATVGNGQFLLEEHLISASAYGNFGIGLGAATDVENSALATTNNSQDANAVGNTAANSLSIKAVNIIEGDDTPDTNSALLSVQFSDDGTDVSASSTAGFYSPAQVLTSSATIGGNSIQTLAAINDVANALDIDATNLAGGANSVASTDDTLATAADHLLQSIQSAVGDVSATSLGVFGNLDSGTAGVNGSTVQIVDNSVSAQSTVNQASNTASVNGSAANSASAALTNFQESEGSSTATAQSYAGPDAPSHGLTVHGGVGDSAIDVSGNETASLARGNSATNAFDFGGGILTSSIADVLASFDTQDPASDLANVGVIEAAADALLLNGQANSADIESVSNGQFGMLLNGDVLNSSLGASGNSVSSAAFGNAASSTLNVTGINNGASALLFNAQDNFANDTAISATSTAVISVTAQDQAVPVETSTVNNVAVGVTGNAINAVAAGNSASNTLNYTGTLLTPLNGGGASLAGGTATFDEATGVLSASADAVLLNSQSNSMAVTATATTVSATIAFNGTGLSPSNVTNSALNVSGNTVNAVAYGNTVNNTLNMASVNNAASAAIASHQVNSGAITASVSANIGITIAGSVSGSALSVGGNVLSATAIGNNAINSMGQ